MSPNLLKHLLLLGASGLLWTGCASKTTYVDPAGRDLIVTTDTVNIQDFSKAADEMSDSLINKLINQNKLRSGIPGEPALLAISDIKNNTGQQLDVDLLIKQIRIRLLETGKVQTSTTIRVGGAEDSLAAEQVQAQESSPNGKRARGPDYTLSGKIIEDRARAGKVRQTSYIFQLSLTAAGTGAAVWEDMRTIVKQGSRPSVGF